MHPNIWKHAASETRESDVLGPVLLVPGVERERDGDYLDSESKKPTCGCRWPSILTPLNLQVWNIVLRLGLGCLAKRA